MRTIMIALLSILLSVFSAAAQNNEQPEVFIIGTMHEVPKIVKHSYRPLLRLAKKYAPDAIYTENQRPEDSVSFYNYNRRNFLPYSDSIAKIFRHDPQKIDLLKTKKVNEMSKEDYDYLRHYYAANQDRANWYYYNYLYRFGPEGSKKPLRNENGDLTSKLAIAMNHNFVYSMDNQWYYKEYHQYWRACVIESRKDGEAKYIGRANKMLYRRAIFPAIFGRLGRHTNNINTLKRYDLVNKFTFRKTPCEPCEKGGYYWDKRNEMMAKNIGEQVLANNHQKSVVIVGAGHVLGIQEELKKQFPSIKVSIIDQ